jgi:N-acetylmuramoyl-L-alanine amidase-like
MIRLRSNSGPVGWVIGIGVLVWLAFFRGGGDGADAPPPSPADASVATSSPSWSEEDWGIFSSKVRWALDERLDTLPLGSAMAAMGVSFVGTAYVPRTLEAEGAEHVVVNFHGLDCVTFVENMFALSRFVRGVAADSVSADPLADRAAAEHAYEALLEELRYRDGHLNGYPTRLHYFTDWIGDNARRGLVENITPALGGVRDAEPIDFMTTHPEAYRQLGDPENLDALRATEARLDREGRYYLPEDRIGEASAGIRDGDVIAATSTVSGLDVAHTGLALWIDGTLHLLHAPLVGDAVQISELSLAERIERISGQDGVIVARPVER